MLGGAFAWIAQASATLPYPVIAIQMVMMGSAIGAITIPATESILGVLPPPRPGSESAINDTTGETGGTLRVAIIGRVYNLAVYPPADHRGDLPHAALAATKTSVAAGYAIARHAPPPLARTSCARHRMSPRGRRSERHPTRSEP